MQTPRSMMVLFVLLAVLCPWTVGAQPEAAMHVEGVDVAMVHLDGRDLFPLRGVSIYTAERRSAGVSERIRALARDPSFATNLLEVVAVNDETRIVFGDTVVLRVLDGDAALLGIDRSLAGEILQLRIAEAVESYRHERELKVLLFRFIRLVFLSALLAGAIWLVRFTHRRMRHFIQVRVLRKIEAGVQIQSFKVVHGENIWKIYRGLMDFLFYTTLAFVIYLGNRTKSMIRVRTRP